VLKAIHTAEVHRDHGSRNILKLLSVNTRRTKVVALSTGTHRVPDELRRHQLSDDDGNEVGLALLTGLALFTGLSFTPLSRSFTPCAYRTS
jgi:hypothetical protein